MKIWCSSWVFYNNDNMVLTYTPIVHDPAPVVLTDDLKIEKIKTQYDEPPKDLSI